MGTEVNFTPGVGGAVTEASLTPEAATPGAGGPVMKVMFTLEAAAILILPPWTGSNFAIGITMEAPLTPEVTAILLLPTRAGSKGARLVTPETKMVAPLRAGATATAAVEWVPGVSKVALAAVEGEEKTL